MASESGLAHSRRVVLCGESFGIRSDQPPETIESVAALVDERFCRARDRMGESDRFRASVLAGLQIAGDLVEARRERDLALEELARIRQRLEELTQRLSEE